MKHNNLLLNNDSRSHAFDKERLLTILNSSNLDFRDKLTKTNAFTLLHNVKSKTKNALNLERFVRTTL
jgi:heptaprenylglyceryl phosphate synthase